MDDVSVRKLPWLFAVALVLLITLLIAPPMGWLVRGQLKMAMGRQDEMISLFRDLGLRDFANQRMSVTDADVNAAVDRNPRDYPIQLAYALIARDNANEFDFDLMFDRLISLRARFPNNPSVLAQILRHMTLRQVHVARPEERFLYNNIRVQAMPNRAIPTAPPANLAEFDQIAAAGEQSDPQNAYFPAMRSIGLFSAYKDREALSALRRAAAHPKWDEYVVDEVEGRRRLNEAVFGKGSALFDAASSLAILYPQYAAFRAVARMSTYKAVEAEQAGHMDEGFAIRRTLRKFGGNLCSRSSNAIGTLVGNAICSTSLVRPGGSPALNSDPNLSRNQNLQHGVDTYCGLLEKNGHETEAKEVRDEIKDCRDARVIIETGIKQSPSGAGRLLRLAVWWFGSIVLLSNVIWFVLFGLSTWLMLRIKLDSGFAFAMLTFAMLAILAFLALNSRCGELFGTYASVVEMMLGESITESPGGPMVMAAGTVAVAVTLPSLALVVALINSRLGNMKVSLAMAGVAAKIAAILAVAYFGVTINTLRQENDISQGLWRSMQGEGAYYAELLNKKWPGPPK